MEPIIYFVKKYSVYIVILLSIFLCFIYFLKRKNKLNLNIFIIFLISILNTILGVLACKAMYFLEYYIGHNLMKTPNFHLTSGFSFFGSVYLMPLFYVAVAKILKKDVKEMLNIGVPAILISSFCARLNCVIHGCCGGIAIGTAGWYFPTRLVELICYISIFIIIIYKNKKGTLKPGMALPIYYMIYGVVRVIEEPLRLNFKTDSIHFGLFHSQIVAIIGIITYWTFFIQSKKQKNIGEKDERGENT